MVNNIGHLSLVAAIEQGNISLIEQLVARGVDVNQRGRDPDGQTPLMLAAGLGKESVVQALLAAGASPDACGSMTGQTPLMLGLEYPEVLETLVIAGATVNLRTAPRPGGFGGGQTALHLAAGANNPVALKILIGAGANLESKDDRGSTPLDLALSAGNLNEAATVLMEAGADVTPERRARMHSAADPAYLRPQELLAVTQRGRTSTEPPEQRLPDGYSETILALLLDTGVSRWVAGLKVIAFILVAAPILVVLDYVTANRNGGSPWTLLLLQILIIGGALFGLVLLWLRMRRNDSRDKPQ
jgi:ankyrin repeat protein